MEHIKNKIISSIEAAKAQGITLVCEDWGSKENKCACALGCLLITNHCDLSEDDPDKNEFQAMELLGVPDSWINNFINGFDDERSTTLQNIEAWQLGQELRLILNPVNHMDYISDLEEKQNNLTYDFVNRFNSIVEDI